MHIQEKVHCSFVTVIKKNNCKNKLKITKKKGKK